IPPMQAFWVYKASGAAGTLTFPKTARVEATKSFYRTGEDIEKINALKIVSSDGIIGDTTYIRFLEEATKEYDAKFDANKKMSDPGYPSLFTTLNGRDYSINSI